MLKCVVLDSVESDVLCVEARSVEIVDGRLGMNGPAVFAGWTSARQAFKVEC